MNTFKGCWVQSIKILNLTIIISPLAFFGNFSKMTQSVKIVAYQCYLLNLKSALIYVGIFQSCNISSTCYLCGQWTLYKWWWIWSYHQFLVFCKYILKPIRVKTINNVQSAQNIHGSSILEPSSALHILILLSPWNFVWISKRSTPAPVLSWNLLEKPLSEKRRSAHLHPVISM